MSDCIIPGASANSSSGRLAPVYVVGLGLPVAGAGPGVSFNERAAHPALVRADVLVGGKAQLAAFADHPADKLLVGADTASLYQRMEANRKAGLTQVVLCGGDPLFFGLGARLAERFGPDAPRILPGLSSLQAAAAFLGLPWEKAESVSLHGRKSWLPLAHALIRAGAGGGPVFVLTDAASSPAVVAAFMKERGHGHHVMHVLGNLYFAPDGGNGAASCRGADNGADPYQAADRSAPLPETASALPPCHAFPTKDASGQELSGASAPSVPAAFPIRVRAEYYARLTVDQALCLPPEPKCGRQVVIWIEPGPPEKPATGWPFGVPDSLLATENNLLTKAPVRAAGLAALGIEAGGTVWDLGAGSGAVSVEAARLAWRGQVIAVEGKAGRILLIEENRRRFGAANLEIVHGLLPEALEQCLALYPRPGRVFFGGGLGRVSGDEGRGEGSNGADQKNGHSGRGRRADSIGHAGAERIFRSAWEALLPGGRMVVHCVLLSTLEFVRAELDRLGVAAEVACIQASRSAPLAGGVRLQAMNPVFLVSASKP